VASFWTNVSVKTMSDEFESIMRAQTAEWGDPIEPAMEKRDLSEWTVDREGLALKACATRTPFGTQYGLIIARRAEEGNFDDPRNLTREQMAMVMRFIGAVLKDSEG
jgi:hypothetical protein